MTNGRRLPVFAAVTKPDAELLGATAISDADIARAAQLWREFYGASALTEARSVALALRDRGDLVSADRWVRLIIAIEMQTRAGSA
jgi:hypothetical protein